MPHDTHPLISPSDEDPPSTCTQEKCRHSHHVARCIMFHFHHRTLCICKLHKEPALIEFLPRRPSSRALPPPFVRYPLPHCRHLRSAVLLSCRPNRPASPRCFAPRHPRPRQQAAPRGLPLRLPHALRPPHTSLPREAAAKRIPAVTLVAAAPERPSFALRTGTVRFSFFDEPSPDGPEYATLPRPLPLSCLRPHRACLNFEPRPGPRSQENSKGRKQAYSRQKGF